ncbi:MAG: HAMP domain-containing histidine kinase [Acidimicrobiales bacterium]|nr:HAMP domain-containing histidine kinase [Acidimicrobiales bacterium]RZV43395.1 MAG: HAMP domain-containing histidine kinase [Acidimicrobiales bacterium]
MKLQARLALTVAAAASVAIFLVAAAFWVLAAREQRNSIDTFLRDQVASVRELPREIAARGRPDRRPDFDQGTVVRFRVETDQRGVLIDDGLPEVGKIDQTQFSTVELDGERYRMIAAPAGSGNRSATIQVARNIEATETGLSQLRRQIALGSLLGIALAGLLGALVARRLTEPITAVAGAAKQMALRQDLPSRINVDRTDEVGDLADSFNQMLNALEVSRDQQQRLVADASHELRTPLTSLRLKIDLLDSTPDIPDSQRQELLSGAAAELERLTDLVTELVDLASDPTGVDEPAAEVDVGLLVNEVAERVRRTTGRVINVDAPSAIVTVRPRMVRRAVSNLLDNAVKYSTESPIDLRFDMGRFEVQDRGPGIAKADLDHIFDRFYRSSLARTQPGNGIGLAIVQRVAALHGGEVWARNADEGGAIVGFSVGMDSADRLVD